jgi:hypothetical protein
MAGKGAPKKLLFFGCLLFFAAGILQTWPLLRHLPSAVPYSAQPHPGHEVVPRTQGDHLQLIYHFWLFGDSVEGGRPFFPTSLEFSTGDREPAFSTQFFPLSFAYWALSPLGPAAAYNILVLSSFILAGLAGCLLSSLFFSPAASLVGGLVFALLPFRYGQLMGGHSNGFVSFLAPLSLYLMIRAFRDGSRGAAFFSGLFFLFLCSTDLTAAYFTSFFYFPLLLLLTLSPPLPWIKRAAEKGPLTLPPRIARLSDGPAIPFAVGAAAGLAYHLFLQRSWTDPAWFGTGLLSIPWHGLLAILAWKACAALLGLLPGLPGAAARRLSSGLMLPFFLLLLYPLGMHLAVPYWGRSLVLLSAAGSLALLVAAARRGGGSYLRIDGAPLLRYSLKPLLPLLIMSAVALGTVAYEKHSRISTSSIGEGRTYQEMKIYSPRLGDYFSLDLSDAEKALYPGLAALLLCLLYLAFRQKGPAGTSSRSDRVVTFFLWGGLLSALLALGPRGEHISPLFPLVREAIPLYDLSRAPSRIFLLTAIALSLGAAGGTAILTDILPPRRQAAVIAVLCLFLMKDYLPPSSPGLSGLPGDNGIYALAAEGPRGGRVMDVPIWPGDSAWSSLYLYYATLHGTRTINGYSPIVPKDYFGSVFLPLEDVNLGVLGEGEHRRLRELDVNHVIFHEEAFPPKVSPYPAGFSAEGLMASPYLEFLRREGPLWLFRLKEAGDSVPGPAAASTVMGKVFEGEHFFLPPGRTRPDTAASGGMVVDFPPGSFELNRPFPAKGKYPAGDYRVRALFPVTEGRSRPGVSLGVLNRDTTALLATGSLPLEAAETPSDGSVIFLEASFTLSRATPLNFELSSGGSGPLTWDFLYLLHTGEEDPRWQYEAEDLVHMGRTIEQEGAGGGQVVELTPDRDPGDYALLGPDRILAAGTYRAFLKYRAIDGPSPPGRFEVALSNSVEPLALAEIPPPLPGTEDWQRLTLPFSLSRPAPVRFRVFYKGSGTLLLDRIAIEGEATP